MPKKEKTILLVYLGVRELDGKRNYAYVVIPSTWKDEEPLDLHERLSEHRLCYYSKKVSDSWRAGNVLEVNIPPKAKPDGARIFPKSGQHVGLWPHRDESAKWEATSQVHQDSLADKKTAKEDPFRELLIPIAKAYIHMSPTHRRRLLAYVIHFITRG